MAKTQAIEDAVRKYNFLKSKRDSYDAEYKDLVKYLSPSRGMFEGDNPGENKNDRYAKIIDPSATVSLRLFAAGLQGGLNSPARPWFKIQSSDPDKNKHRAFKEYFHAIEAQIYNALDKSNFYNQSHLAYYEQGAFGTAALSMEPDYRRIVRFSTMTVGEYWVDVGTDGVVDTLCRKLYMTAKNMVARWGRDRVTTAVRTAMDNKHYYTLFPVYHLIEPRENRDATRIDVLNMQHKSIYFELAGEDVLGESGFRERPVAVPRWDNVNHTAYGVGPGHEVLRQVKMLQEMQMTKLRAEHLKVDPPLVGPMSLKDKRINSLPGGRNYMDMDKAGQYGPLFNVNYDIQAAIEGINDVRSIIERCLYTDLFIMLEQKPDMTATEILERKEEKLFALGPAIERQTDEFLEAVIDFTYAALLDRRMIPPAPQELEGEELEIDYISSLAQAQKLAGLRSTQAYITVGIDLSAAVPEVLDKMDVDKIMDEVADITGIPPALNRSDEEVQEIRERRQQAIDEAKGEEQATMDVERMKVLSQADLGNGQNALTALQGAM
ncbi:MAG TPA: portal protein [Anaerohalosphaeraceae bacterium]|nr:portal protein [Anaerohalosphaeraceae bacterium]